MTVAALIVAAGRGTRAGGRTPKQWRKVAGQAVIEWTIAAFADHPAITEILLVIRPGDEGRVPSGISHVHGGRTRTASVRAGLEELEGRNVSRVLIHDAARACVSHRVISSVLDALDESEGAAPGLAIRDALWMTRTQEDGSGGITGFRDRQELVRAQTPQGFRFKSILAAHRAHVGDAADDVEIAHAAGIDVHVIAGEEDNLKITTPGDFARAERILLRQMDIRLGNGYDVHRFGPGDRIILCGTEIPHDRGLQGHSDADVGAHAITDAIYGALAEGDIGSHFPASDPRWKDADSRIFLVHACDLARDRGYSISNADCTLICEYPKIGPYTGAMRQVLSRAMNVATDRISIKATTSERLGFTGRGEGIAAMATVTLIRR